MSYYVYLHIKESNGEPFYVGKGKDCRAFKTKRRTKWWKNIVNKHGFDVVMLEEDLTELGSLELERYWIKRIGRKDLNEGTLVNLTDGGDGVSGNVWSNERRKQASERMKGKPSNKKGKKLSEETRLNMSKLKKGLEIKGRTVLDLETGVYYYSIADASRCKGIKKSTLDMMLRGINKNRTNLILL